MTFAAIEAQGVEGFLERIRDELVQHTYMPLPARRQEIPKDGGKSASFRFQTPPLSRPTLVDCTPGPAGPQQQIHSVSTLW